MAPDATAADGDIGAGGSAIVDRCLAGAGFVLMPRRSLQDRFGAGAAGGSQTGTAGRTPGCPVCCCSTSAGISGGGGIAPTAWVAEDCMGTGRAPLDCPGTCSGLVGGG
jgi:hypothetical protein